MVVSAGLHQHKQISHIEKVGEEQEEVRPADLTFIKNLF
jgi:hypothetical protein